MEQCPAVTWCDQGLRPHTDHEQTLGTWHGHTPHAPQRTVDAQLVVHGSSERDVRLVIVLVDSAAITAPVQCELDWPDVPRMSWQMHGAVGRFGSRRSG